MKKNYEWLITTNLSQYQGEWVIIANESVIAHGQNLNKLYTKVDKKFPNEELLTLSVPKKGDYIL